MKPDEIKYAIRGYLSENITNDSTEHRLLAYAMTYIETLEGVIKADPRYFGYDLLSLVRDTCEGYLHCSECPLSDADGDCPFIGKDGGRLLPCDWELWRMAAHELRTDQERPL